MTALKAPLQDTGWMGDPRRGAAMGRSDVIPPTMPPGTKIHIQKIRLNDGGYDRGNAYWGACPGEYLYWAGTEEIDESGEYLSMFFRASDRDDAKAQVFKRFPGVKFFR